MYNMFFMILHAMRLTGTGSRGKPAASRGEGTRAAVQAAARTLLRESTQPVTLQAVAQALGRPRTGLLFHYPAGMGQLVAALAIEDYGRLRTTLAAVRTVAGGDPGRAANAILDHLASLGRIAAAEAGAGWGWSPEVEFSVNRSRSAALAEAARICGSEPAGRLAYLLAVDAFYDVLYERLTVAQARERMAAAMVLIRRGGAPGALRETPQSAPVARRRSPTVSMGESSA